VRLLSATICILLLAAVPIAAGARTREDRRTVRSERSYDRPRVDRPHSERHRSSHRRDRTSIFPAADPIYVPVDPIPLEVRCGYRLHDWRGRYIRCSAARAAFERDHPCPSTGQPSGACPGYVVDHITPLKRGGADLPDNMQWQTLEEAREKDKVE
jgi:hypothetical protein